MKRFNFAHKTHSMRFRHKGEIQVRINNLWMLLTFSLSLLYGNACSAGDNTLTRSQQWLENLSQGDQKIALVNYQISLAAKVNDILFNAKNAKDGLWSAKILMCGYRLAARFAEKNTDQQNAMILMAEALNDYVYKKGTSENNKAKRNKALFENQKIADSITKGAAASFVKRYASDLEDANKSLTAAAILCASSDAIEEERSACSPKGTDVCKLARKVANEMAPLLPMRLNRNLVLHTVFAVNRLVAITAKFEYDRSDLESVLSSSGMNNDDMLKIMQKHAKDGVCQSNAISRSFVNLGGVVDYHYRFNDGSIYTQLRIDSCL